MLRYVKSGMMLMSIAYIVLGLMLLIMPETSLLWICYAFGVVVLITGIVCLIQYARIRGTGFTAPFMLVGGVSPYVWFATHFIDAILIGPVFMLMVAKVRKNGPFLLTSLITGVVLVAATWMFPITGLVGGILCELCLRAGQFRRKSWLMLGFFCFNLGFIGDFLPLWFTKESYLEYAAQMMDAGYMATMEGLLTWPVFGVIVLSILVGSVLGSLLGMKLMRKHFVKAGLAQ